MQIVALNKGEYLTKNAMIAALRLLSACMDTFSVEVSSREEK